MIETIDTTDRWYVTTEDAKRLGGITNTHLYAALAAGRINAVKAGRRTLIEVGSLRGYLASLPKGQYGTKGKAAA